jgi:hypothetical protein
MTGKLKQTLPETAQILDNVSLILFKKKPNKTKQTFIIY